MFFTIRRIDTFFTLLTLVFFCSLIYSPALVMFFTKKEQWSAVEKRSLAMMPIFPSTVSGISDYFSELNEYLQDHFGFRDVFIHRYQRELAKRFDKGGSNSKVIRGLDGWLFFDHFGLIDDFFGHTPLDDQELDLWIEQVEERKQWLKQHQIHYLHVLAPNKQSIYPQYVMKNGKRLQGVTRFQQLRKRFSTRFPEYLVDIHSALEKKADEGQLYFKKDSHWNRKGAYIAYLEMIKTLARWFPDEHFKNNFQFDADIVGIGGNLGNGGDLRRMILLEDRTDLVPVLRAYEKCAQNESITKYKLSDIVFSRLTPSFRSLCRQKKLRAVVFRDSFFNQMEPFFSENFREVIYLWKRYDQQNIEEIMKFWKPDLVVEMTVERHAFDFLFSD